MTVLLAGILVMVTGTTASAQDYWITKGGTPLRTGRSEEVLGPMRAPDWWSLDGEGADGKVGNRYVREGFEATATQPLVLGNMIYHVAGKHIWRIVLGDDKKPVPTDDGVRTLNGGQDIPPRPNADPKRRYVDLSIDRSPASTPTYSPQSGIIYWGTSFGELWAYRTREGTMDSIPLEYPCMVVGSPLVLRVNGQDVVVVGDRPATGSSSCGNVWVVSGLEAGSRPMKHHTDRELIRGWVTPSAVPGPDPSEFLIGSDAGSASKAMKFAVVQLADGSFEPEYQSGEPSDSGLAGTFVSDANGNTYWLDTAGKLYRYNGYTINGTLDLKTAVGATGAFTNTEPAIGSDGSIYVTLRNLWFSGETGRPDPGTLNQNPGPPGAVLKINPDFTLDRDAWKRLPTDTPLADGYHRAANTAPLVVQSPGGLNAVALGDTNGNMYLYETEDLTPIDAWADSPGAPPPAVQDSSGKVVAYPYPLLHAKDGEQPARGDYTYSQKAGVGTDPMVGNRLLMAGVNYTKSGSTPQHRLVAYYNPEPYNLSWAEASLSPQGRYDANDAVTVSGQIKLEASQFGPGTPLSGIRNGNVNARWYITKDTTTLENLEEIGTPALLPPDITDGSLTGATASFPALERFPQKGIVVGVIDIEKVARYARDSLGGRIAARAGIPPDEEASDHYETAYDDNVMTLPYEMRLPLNLSVKVFAYDRTDHLEIDAYVTNNSRGTVDGSVPVAGSVDSSSSGTFLLPVRQISVAPGTTEQLTYGMPLLGCELETFDVSVRVNPSPSEANRETTYQDNGDHWNATAGVPNCGFTAPIEGGERRAVIVPSDCMVITDPTDRQLCEQYRKQLP